MPLESKAQQILQAGVDYFEKRKLHEIEEAKRRAAAEEERRQRELEWARRQAAWKRKKERKKKRQKEQRKIKELAEAASQWSRSEQVRNFIPLCEARMREAVGSIHPLDDLRVVAVRHEERESEVVEQALGGKTDALKRIVKP